MNYATQLANRFREVILNGTWIANTNYKDQLQGLDWQIATKPMQNLNTIAVLAQHIHYYIKGVKEVFKGGELTIKDSLSFDFSPIRSQEQWDTFLTNFWKDAEEFADLVAQLSETQLSEYFVDEKYSTYLRNVDSMIEHSYYHLGQIVLIKKMLTN
jgi:uncharacterized damage-inducible protein DinB